MINIYIIKHNNFHGKPIFYENDQALCEAMRKMYDALGEDDNADVIRDEILRSFIYKIGVFDPIAGKIKSTFGKRFVGTLADILKGGQS